ncbi:Uncharacterized protein dnl_04370 [Desulfonema limicola]|uniref:Uncharacterized protein n=1 Tax=Desulfonema limicola TaxID=45656 RepID=A0A975B3P2_9BACT|nr:hypothetical protein [Desulfonema limicola]QTA78220.1 Uncharacterized protein dnl_04370 [Desulfonema limicola]
MSNTIKELELFIENWTDTEEENKKAFVRFKDYLAAMPGVILDYVPREGVTYSLRAVHENQKDKSLFVMVDVIEDEPRWLSVCFYGEMISDPDDIGDFVPEGLLGEDAMCFDLEEYDEDKISYIEARLDEACESGAKE